MLFEERIELMRKAKIAAIVCGGVSTCLCGSLLGVYSDSSTVSSVAPQNNVENIYDVQSEKLANENVAAVTSIRTTAITTTSTTSTTSSENSAVGIKISDSETHSTVNATTAVNTVATTVNTTVEETAIVTETTAPVENETVENVETVGGFTISGPFIASEEPEECIVEVTPDEDVTTEEDTEYTDTTTEEDFVFEPSTEYYPPAVEYIAPVQETTTEVSTESTSTETTTEETTTTTEEITTTTTEETTTTTEEITTTTTEETTTTTEEITTTTEETTTTTTTEATTTTEENTTTTETTTTTISAAYVVSVDYTIPEGDSTTTTVTASALPVTDAEYILLCNAVANEAGSDWIDRYQKANVVEVIMNRVNSPLYPDNIFDVITQVNQFENCYNYVYLTTYSSYVTDDVIAAVELYFNEPGSFTQNYFGFYGDGYQNYFY